MQGSKSIFVMVFECYFFNPAPSVSNHTDSSVFSIAYTDVRKPYLTVRKLCSLRTNLRYPPCGMHIHTYYSIRSIVRDRVYTGSTYVNLLTPLPYGRPIGRRGAAPLRCRFVERAGSRGPKVNVSARNWRAKRASPIGLEWTERHGLGPDT